MKKIVVFAKILGIAAFCFASSCSKPSTTDVDSVQIVLENIATRSSVRQFTDRPVDKSTLETIVRAGMAAPSAMNKQPWAFVVVTEREVLDSLMNVHPYSNLKTATAAVIVCGDMEKASNDFGREYWIQDCSAATENILLAAHALGVGAVWCGVYPNPNIQPEVKRVLGLPDGIIPLNIITMGYPAYEPQPKDKWIPENIHYQRW